MPEVELINANPTVHTVKSKITRIDNENDKERDDIDAEEIFGKTLFIKFFIII